MTSKTLTRTDLTEATYNTVGLSRAEAADLVEQVIREISAALTSGESVKLSGFGVFTVRQMNRRIGRNPKTGAEVPIEARRSLTFSASPLLKARVDGRTSKVRSRRNRRGLQPLEHSATTAR
jgi:integration host factor subunit alpha